MIVNMIIVLELECLVSKQWLQQMRGFQPGQPGSAARKNALGRVYTGISGYIQASLCILVGPHTLHIE